MPLLQMLLFHQLQYKHYPSRYFSYRISVPRHGFHGKVLIDYDSEGAFEPAEGQRMSLRGGETKPFSGFDPSETGVPAMLDATILR